MVARHSVVIVHHRFSKKEEHEPKLELGKRVVMIVGKIIGQVYLIVCCCVLLYIRARLQYALDILDD